MRLLSVHDGDRAGTLAFPPGGSLAMRTSTIAAAVAITAVLVGAADAPGRAQSSATTPSTTEGIEPALLTGLMWRSIGPARGGRSQAVAGSSSRPLEYYFGAAGGGLWKTADGGVTWRAVSDKFFNSSSVG